MEIENCSSSEQELFHPGESHHERQPVNGSQKSTTMGRQPGPHIGIYGWRKRCLYLLILALLVVVILNLALTLWVIKVMEFNTNGMGELRIVAGGVQLSGQTYVLDTLLASNIRSRFGQSLSLETSHNFTVNTRDRLGQLSSMLYVGHDKMECLTSSFKVSDPHGRTLFSADKHEVVVGADVLKVTGSGGAVFDGSVQTPLVRAGSGSNLILESATRSLQVMAPAGVNIESRAGDISASCLKDLKMESIDGAIRLEAASVILPGLKTASLSPPHLSRQSGDPSIYQLCVCGNGKLFLSAADGHCATDNEALICR
ncbi:sarcoglycan delta isoform X2 [Lycorma delicatula]|uniref:sarcoglycan delta isoform X2 n=1 Tax=Lycorma delicatula TaxID=130591 RepID=UPI003F516C98